MITNENIESHELIGLKTEIVDSTNKEILGLNGTIVDETKSMFLIETSMGFKIIPKNHNKWKFSVQNKDIVLFGSALCKRSFDRMRFKL